MVDLLESNPPATMQIFDWNEVDGKDRMKLIEYLKRKFELHWLTSDNVRIEKNENLTKILAGNKFLSIKLDDNKDKATLNIDDDRTVDFLVERSCGRILIDEILSPRDVALSFIAGQVSRRTRELGYSIIRCFNSPTLVQDMEILNHDERFKRLGKETEEEFKECNSRFVGSMREN
jgi:hypothetical protein